VSPRRSKLEIQLSILSAIQEGVDKPTRIMYAANMSWKPVQEILSRLVEQGLITIMTNPESEQSKKRYVISEKGSKVLTFFNDAKNLMQIEGINIF
jgi:predicted transcriptional regulator